MELKTKNEKKTFTFTMTEDEANAISSALADLGDKARKTHIVFDFEDIDVKPRKKTRKIYREFADLVDAATGSFTDYDYDDWFKPNEPTP